MGRGDHIAITKNRLYLDSKKEWYVELVQSDMVWYDLLVNEHDAFPFRSNIKERFKQIDRQVRESLEKRFIYFIASRKRVRFSLRKRPRYSRTGKYIHYYFEVGRKKELIKVKVRSEFNSDEKPKIEVTEKFITFYDYFGNNLTMSVHDFLLSNQINLGYSTHVHYVGKTKKPFRRPLDGSHSGLNKVLYSLSNEENDIFIFFNLFKTMAVAENDIFQSRFIVSNSMTDEIDVDKEGDILEKSLIFHFSSEIQTNNIEKELGELKNNLAFMVEENLISKINFFYEVDDESEYYKFGSSTIAPAHSHAFCLTLNEGIIKKEGFSGVDEL